MIVGLVAGLVLGRPGYYVALSWCCLSIFVFMVSFLGLFGGFFSVFWDLGGSWILWDSQNPEEFAQNSREFAETASRPLSDAWRGFGVSAPDFGGFWEEFWEFFPNFWGLGGWGDPPSIRDPKILRNLLKIPGNLLKIQGNS